MKQVFKKVKAQCAVCSEPVDERYKRGNKYYCFTHFQQTSPEEKQANNFQKQRTKNYHKLFGH